VCHRSEGAWRAGLALVGQLASVFVGRAIGLAASTSWHSPGNILISTEAGNITVKPLLSSDQQAATLTSTTADFLAWSTARSPWRALVAVAGDKNVAGEFLDAINLI
jgi:hypothetical protein